LFSCRSTLAPLRQHSSGTLTSLFFTCLPSPTTRGGW
jgi:hypothetical protein